VQMQSFQYYGGYWTTEATAGFSGGEWIQGSPPDPPALPAPVASEISQEHRNDVAPREDDASFEQTEPTPAPVDAASKAALGLYEVQLATFKSYGSVPCLINLPLASPAALPRQALLASNFNSRLACLQRILHPRKSVGQRGAEET
jgi:hypothetical protein